MMFVSRRRRLVSMAVLFTWNKLACGFPTATSSAMIVHDGGRKFRSFPIARGMSSDESGPSSAVCHGPESDSLLLMNEEGAGNIIRSVVVRNTNGQLVKLGDKMGPHASVVIFLRHLA